MDKYNICCNEATPDVIERLGWVELFKFHRSTGLEIDAEKYLKLHQQILARGILQTTVIYLDTNYWIKLRDATNGTNSAGSELLSSLKRLVRERRVLCVIQAASFLELAKQCPDSLQVVSNLVDELSESVTIVSENKLRAIEAENYVRWKLGFESEQQCKVWTHHGLILFEDIDQHLYELLPQQLNETSSDTIKKCMIDSLWQASMSDILIAFDWKTADKFNAKLDSSTITEIKNRKLKQRERNLSLDDIRKYEFETYIPSTYSEYFFKAAYSIKRAANESIVFNELRKQASYLISCAVNDAQTDLLNQYIPGAVIQTHLYCLYENDISWKLSGNDWFDMRHASVALPYSDYFFTENHLKHQISNVMKFDQEYECKVVSRIDEAIEVLNQI